MASGTKDQNFPFFLINLLWLVVTASELKSPLNSQWYHDTDHLVGLQEH